MASDSHLRLLPDPGQPLLLAEIRLAGGHRATPSERALHAAIPRRQTNREPFSGRAVPPGIRAELAEAASLGGAFLHFLDHGEAKRVLRLVADAERGLLAVPATAPSWRWAGGQRDRDGIPGSALGPRSWSLIWPRASPRPAPRAGPLRLVRTHPQLAVLSGSHGGRWACAPGEPLQRAWLTATIRDRRLPAH